MSMDGVSANVIPPDADVSPDLTFAPSKLSIDPKSLTPSQRSNFCVQYLTDRQRGRTDIIWFCNNVLQYKDVEPEMHGPVANHVQHFNGREEYMDPDTFTIDYSEPHCSIHNGESLPGIEAIAADSCPADCIGRSIWYLDGPHFRMLLDPRGTLKTTVNTIAHSIQWIINFEDIRIALSTATSPQGADIITEVENHFRYNDKFRFLYPEFCPGDKAGDWGSKEQFVVPNRRRKWLKEPTMRIVSIGKVVAGPHYDVIKHSDLVDKENVKTPGGLKDTKDHFKYTMPLLERGPVIPGRDRTVGWVDLEGTIYDHSDLYCEELDKDDERAKRGQPCRWAVHRRDSVAEVVDDQTMWSKPFKVLWPKRFPWSELKAIFEDIGEYMFNCQYRLFPSARGIGLARASEIAYFPARFKKTLVPHLYVKTTVDLAGMEEDTEGCNIAIVTVGHAGDGRKMVLEAMVGRPTPFDIINYFFELDARYSTRLSQKLVIQIELAHHAQALIPFINREMEIRQRFLNLVAIPRDTSVAKDNRIFYGLQPWFKRRLIWFSDDIPVMPHIIKEITKFPKFKFKDFLDALADQGQTVDGKVDNQTSIPVPKDPTDDPLKVQGRFLGFDPVTKMPMYEGDSQSPSADYFGDGYESEMTKHDNMTGAL